jgi:ribosomal protein S18 acetylase RimI-like enzyme
MAGVFAAIQRQARVTRRRWHAEPVIRLQALTADDWRLWRQLRLQALAEDPGAFGARLADWQGPGDREDRWRGRLSIPGGHDVMAWSDEQPCGMASGVPAAGANWITLISMWVTPTARGRGVGDALVAEIVRYASDVGAGGVHLDVAEDNHAARRLYERHGFRVNGEVGDLMPDGLARRLVMTLLL